MLGFDIINLIFFCLYKKRKHKAKQIFLTSQETTKYFGAKIQINFSLEIEV